MVPLHALALHLSAGAQHNGALPEQLPRDEQHLVHADARAAHLYPDPVRGRQAQRVGGIAEPIARAIQEQTGKECRSLVLGHLQRGGMPTGYDRLLAMRFGGAAVRAVKDGRWGEMVALQPPSIVTVPIAKALEKPKRVDLGSDLMLTARAAGISFGD